MDPRQRSCFNCHWTRPRTPTEDLSGPAQYWCEKRQRYLGNVILGGEACEDYEPWDMESAEEELGKN